ncbi:hypothetical protein PG993_005446 [Apiospora rasikravindrae]|uniref:Polyketide synthase n=1 Tax=Apiospora rasikravindrae TaxID=990691 RepID=A0ABR1TFL6_9PEZI
MPEPLMPIAIVGIAGRFPGDAENPERLWDMVCEGRNALTKVPSSRFNSDAFCHPHGERQGTTNVDKAHFMNHDISAFDAPFFNLRPKEVKAMDPQQRMALECTYEALENGKSISENHKEQVSGSNTSCYIGYFTRDYGEMLSSDRYNLPIYQPTGNGNAIMSNRISWYFNMKGPSITIDTACSSSLVALHLACQSLRTGESTMSVVGGTNLILLPDMMGAMASMQFLSPDGKSQAFDEKANGYARGEGAAFCILKPLELAITNGDVIRGVIRNSAVNQDGYTNGITLPSCDAQQALIRKVYADAGLSLAHTGYVEAHGTGTPAGDPLEAEALGKTFGQARRRDDPVYIGSIKSNVGHLEGGSGLAQVIKAVKMLEHGMIPASLHYEKPNPKIHMNEWNLRVPTELTPWPDAGLRRISINSFGYGGTNAHVIIDDACSYMKANQLAGNHNVQTAVESSPVVSHDSGMSLGEVIDPMALENALVRWEAEPVRATPSTPSLLPLSSNDLEGIDRTRQAFSKCLRSKLDEHKARQTSEIFDRLVCTLTARRSRLPWKSFVVASSLEGAISALEGPIPKPLRSTDGEKIPPLVFVFTGQGAQWYAMGRELLHNPVFRERICEADLYFKSLGASWSLKSELQQDSENTRLGLAHIGQPACTALQVALVDLLYQWSIFPDAVIGHSSGEIAAAYAKKAITRQDAWSVAYYRGHLASHVGLTGAMMATGLGYDDAAAYTDRHVPGRVVVGCVNSPQSTTLSGDAEAIEKLESIIKGDGHFTRKLENVDVAYHSDHMRVVAETYRQALAHVSPLPEDPRGIKMFSSLHSKVVSSDMLGPDYWVDNMVSPVNFLGGMQALMKSQVITKNRRRNNQKGPAPTIIELGPHGALQGPLHQIFACGSDNSASVKELNYQSILERGKCATETTLTLAGKLFQLGYPIDIEAVNGPTATAGTPFLVDLPPFSWNHNSKYWYESPASRAHRFRKHPRTDLLGYQTLDLLDHEPRFRNILRGSEVPWMRQHKVHGTTLYPATGMLVMAIEAMRQKFGPGREIEGYELRDVLIGKALIVPEVDDEGRVETMLTVRPSQKSSAWQEFQLYSLRESWERNCSGLMRIRYKSSGNSAFASEDEILASKYRKENERITKEYSRYQKPQQFYSNLESTGLQYGPVFQGLVSIEKGDYQSVCTIRIPDTKSTMRHNFEYPHVIHPATLDSVIQMNFLSCSAVNKDTSESMVPTAIGRVYVSANMPTEPGIKLPGFSCAEKVESGEGKDLMVLGQDTQWSKPLVIVEDLQATALPSPIVSRNLRKPISDFHWELDVTLLNSGRIKKLCQDRVDSRGTADKILSVELDLERACSIIIRRVMAEITPEEAGSLVGRFKLYWDYMNQCHEKGLRGELWHQTPALNRGLGVNMNSETEDEFLTRVSRATADGAALVEHGRHLPRILRGEVGPHEILMKDNLLYDFYQHGLGEEQGAEVAYYVDLMAHKNPNMKILEVGAGTAGTTVAMLQTLGGIDGTSPRFDSYMFTDMSTGYFEKARQKLAPWLSSLQFALLDIEEDPEELQFEPYSYDLVFAFEVLHATRNIKQTLANVRKLLKPGGKLILTEITNAAQKMRFHMTVGSFEGWWYGEEDGRHGGPTLSIREWDNAMKATGFTGVDFDFGDYPDEHDLSTSLIVTTASHDSVESNSLEALVILPNQHDEEVLAFKDQLSELLVNRGCKVLVRQLHETTDLELKNRSSLVLLDASKREGCLPSISKQDWEALQHIILSSRDTIYVTRGGAVESQNPSANLMTGLARSIRSENFDCRLTTLDLDYESPLDTQATVSAVCQVFIKACNAKNGEAFDWEVAVRKGLPMVPRAVLGKEMNDVLTELNVPPEPREMPFHQEGRPLTLAVGKPGRLDTLHFREDPRTAAQVPLGETEVEIEIKAVGLNFKDIIVAMGHLEQSALGLDCSGIVRRIGSGVTQVGVGHVVMTWKMGALGNRVRAEESMVQLVPQGMDLVTAASLPLVYSTAHYALSDIARLRRGETVLIHGAAGGVGQASIILAEHIGAQVFVTVSSEEKKQLLIKEYGIAEENIFDSRDTQFAAGVLRMTKDKGVDVVLNSLAGESLRLSWHCIARFGRFVELGKMDIVGNTGLDMKPFLRNVSFHGVDMIDLRNYDVATTSRVFSEVRDLLDKRIIRPVHPITPYPMSQVEEAFRLMQTSKHTGKIVMEVHEDDIVMATPPPLTAPVRFQPNATYVIAGGSGGLGRCIAEWMVTSGAKNVLLLSRSGDRKPNVSKLLCRLREQGARAAAFECDVGDESQLLACLARCQSESWPKIRGVIQGAMVLRDKVYKNMTHELFLGAVKPKVHGSWNLHKHMPQDMDFFVLLSSSSGVGGQPAQGNYSAGNTYQDALAHHRRGRGLPACSIDIAAVQGVGFLAEETTTDRVHENMRNVIFSTIREHELLAILQAAIMGQSVVGKDTPAQIITGFPTGGMMAQAKREFPAFLDRAKFGHLMRIDTHHIVQGLQKDDSGQKLRAELARATSLDRAVEIVTAALVEKLARLLNVAPEDIDASKSASSLGLDSLVGTEFRSWINQEIQTEITDLDLHENIPISSLARKVATRSKAVPEAAKPQGGIVSTSDDTGGDNMLDV